MATWGMGPEGDGLSRRRFLALGAGALVAGSAGAGRLPDTAPLRAVAALSGAAGAVWRRHVEWTAETASGVEWRLLERTLGPAAFARLASDPEVDAVLVAADVPPPTPLTEGFVKPLLWAGPGRPGVLPAGCAVAPTGGPCPWSAFVTLTSDGAIGRPLRCHVHLMEGSDAELFATLHTLQAMAGGGAPVRVDLLRGNAASGDTRPRAPFVAKFAWPSGFTACAASGTPWTPGAPVVVRGDSGVLRWDSQGLRHEPRNDPPRSVAPAGMERALLVDWLRAAVHAAATPSTLEGVAAAEAAWRALDTAMARAAIA